MEELRQAAKAHNESAAEIIVDEQEQSRLAEQVTLRSRRLGLERSIGEHLAEFASLAQTRALPTTLVEASRNWLDCAGMSAYSGLSSLDLEQPPSWQCWPLLEVPGEERFCVSVSGELVIDEPEASRPASRDDLLYLMISINAYRNQRHLSHDQALDELFEAALSGQPAYIDPFA